MRFLIADLKRIFTERTFLSAVLLGTIAIILSVVVTLGQEVQTTTDLYLRSHALLLPFIAPLLSALPYANMEMLEKDVKYDRLMMYKSGRSSHFFGRWIVNSFAGGVALILPNIILALIISVMKTNLDFSVVAKLSLLNGLFGAAYASLSYGLTFVNRKRYLPIIIPQVFYLLFIYAFPYLGLEKYYPPLCFAPGLLPGLSTPETILLQLGIIGGTGLMIAFCAKCLKRLGHYLSLDLGGEV